MYRRLAMCVITLTVLGVSLSAAADQQDQRVQLPVRKVVLFSSGVGYFEHTGSVEGDAQIQIRFKSAQINDVLKSLVLQDLDGGTVGSVVYPSRDPIAKTLRSFQVDITQNPSLGQLLNQLRGASVKVQALGEQLTGIILGLETKQIAVGDKNQLVTVWVLNLLDGGSLRAVQLDDVRHLELVDQKLAEELNQALAVLAQGRDQEKKPVVMHFNGQGQRRVKVAYVVETPVWKTSYRLIFPDQPDRPAHLQGWAILENQTDSDWNDVQLSLVSGRPISFVQDLYEPLYMPRPTVEPELYARLRPRSYDEGIEHEEQKRLARRRPARRSRMAKGKASALAFDGMPAAMAGEADEHWAPHAPEPLDAAASVASMAQAAEIGELFQYTVDHVSLPRQRSAMIPIISDEIAAEKVSIYNQAVLASHPLNGARLKNTTGMHLLQGPITVFDDHIYAGDAQIGNLGPGQDRLLSYAIDLRVKVNPQPHPQVTHIQSAKIVRGVLEIRRKHVSYQAYTIKNNADTSRTVIIEHPIRPGWDLVDTPSPIETTNVLYRFEQKLGPDERVTFGVKQARVQGETIALLSAHLGAFQVYAQSGEIPSAVREALKKAMRLKQALVEVQREIKNRQGKVSKITSEQSRIRSNMGSVSRNSEYYARLMRKLDDQETKIEQFQMEIMDLEEQLKKRRGEMEDYLANLAVG